nr:MAG: hypothetical protein [Microvirus sp.]
MQTPSKRTIQRRRQQIHWVLFFALQYLKADENMSLKDFYQSVQNELLKLDLQKETT